MKTMMLILALLMAAVPVADGAQSFSWTAWTYDTSTDPMTGATVKIAAILSTNKVEFSFPYNGPQRAILALRKHSREGQSALLAIERGQFVCSIGGCAIRIRFDEQSPAWWDASEPGDYRTNALLIDDGQAFSARLQKAKTVRIAATVYQEGTPVFTFKVAGLKW